MDKKSEICPKNNEIKPLFKKVPEHRTIRYRIDRDRLITDSVPKEYNKRKKD